MLLQVKTLLNILFGRGWEAGCDGGQEERRAAFLFRLGRGGEGEGFCIVHGARCIPAIKNYQLLATKNDHPRWSIIACIYREYTQRGWSFLHAFLPSYMTLGADMPQSGSDTLCWAFRGTGWTSWASASNPIYGRSNTVQPAAYTVHYYIRCNE